MLNPMMKNCCQLARKTLLIKKKELLKLKKEIHAHGLELEAIENFDPAMWYDVLLNGPKREEQMEKLKQQMLQR